MPNKVAALLHRHRPQDVNAQHKAGLHLQDRIALGITTAVGTMYAVYFFILCLTGWMLWQGALAKHPFDPYPFAFLLFMGNIVQLLLMPLIMVGQNIQNKHAELRSNEEYQTTLSGYHDLEAILRHLDDQDERLAEQTKLIQQLMKQQKSG